MTRNRCLGLGGLLVLGLAANRPAQVDFEPFTRTGTPIPGWTHKVAPWTVKDLGGGDLRAESTGTASHSYLLRNKSAAALGVLEAKVTGVTLTCNGGVVFRYDSTRTSGIRACGASSGGQNAYKVLMLDAPGVARTYVVLGKRTKNLTARLLVQGTEARAQFDVDPLDGKWDHELTLKGVSTGPNPYGLYAWHGSYGDDVKFFDAAIFRRSVFGRKTIGATVPLDLYAPTANAPYVLLPSFTTARIPLPNGWFSPILPDALSVAAPGLPGIFASFAGNLDGSGQATAKIHVPNLPVLAGLAVYVAGAVLDGRTPPALVHLFNEERIDLIP